MCVPFEEKNYRIGVNFSYGMIKLMLSIRSKDFRFISMTMLTKVQFLTV